MRHIALAIVLVTACVVAPQTASADYLPAEEDGQARIDGIERVRGYLQSDRFIMSRLELRRLSDDALGDLIKLATSQRTKVLVRSRAIQSIALYHTDTRARSTLDRLARKTKPSDKLFPQVLVAYAQLAGQDGVPMIATFLDHRSDRIRMAAVTALGRFGGQDGFDLLADRLDREGDGKVRAKIAHYVR